MRYHVLGVGSIGSLVAFHLQRHLRSAQHRQVIALQNYLQQRNEFGVSSDDGPPVASISLPERFLEPQRSKAYLPSPTTLLLQKRSFEADLRKERRYRRGRPGVLGMASASSTTAEDGEGGSEGYGIIVEREGVRQFEGCYGVESCAAATPFAASLGHDPRGVLRVSLSSEDRSPETGGGRGAEGLQGLPGLDPADFDLLGLDGQARGDRDPTSPIDSLIVATKAPAVLPALTALMPRITPRTTIVLLQNGMGVLELLLGKLFRDNRSRPHFVVGTATHGAWSKGLLETVHSAFGEIHLGIVPDVAGRDGGAGYESAWEEEEAPGGNVVRRRLSLDGIPSSPSSPTYTLHRTMSALTSLPLSVQWEPIADYHVRALRKLVVNACINPVTALADCRNGDLFTNRDAHALISGVCKEAHAVFEAQAKAGERETTESDVEADAASSSPLLHPGLQVTSLEAEVLRVARLTALNWSSMQQDVANRRGSTEVDFMNGYLGRLGRKYGVPTPINDTLTSMIKFKSGRGIAKLGLL